MSVAKIRISRRNFLLAAGAGGLVTAAAVASKSVTRPAAPETEKKKTASGYQETAHVRNYYRTTKV